MIVQEHDKMGKIKDVYEPLADDQELTLMQYSYKKFFSAHRRTNRFFGIVVILLFAYMLRCYLWFQEPTLSRDGTYYLLQAKGERVADYPLPHGKQAPLFPAILRKMYLCGIDPQKGGIILNIMCSTALCSVVWGTCRYLRLNSFWSLFCTFLIAVHPEYVRCSHELQRESLYLFFSGIAVFMAIINMQTTSRKEKWLTALGFGFAGATAVATRYEGWELFLFFIGCQLYVILKNKQYNAKCLLKYFNNLGIMIVSWSLSMVLILQLSNYPVFYYFEIMLRHIQKIKFGL